MSEGGIGRAVALYAALYGGYGALSPFLPATLAARGFAASQIGTLLAAAMLVRLVVGPPTGRLADRYAAVRGFLAFGLAASSGLTLGLLAGDGLALLVVLVLIHAATSAALSPLADALVLSSRSGAVYGRIRGAGSAAFIATTVLTGWLVGRFGNGAGLTACAVLFGGAALVTLGFAPGAPAPMRGDAGGVRALLANGPFRRLVLAAALVIGAHAMHDAFAVIAWTGAGIGASAAGLLWAEAVAAEVLVFLWLGPRLLGRIGPARALELAALAGALRWAVQAQTTWLPALVAIQALHGLTFALLHLACLRILTRAVPEGLRATALTVYGSLGLGLASALATLAAGPLYGGLGLPAFWFMSGLSLLAVPVAQRLRPDSRQNEVGHI
ncbi:MFS transporter [Methylorubrum salsuginis]|uniref:MFS transporter, PPP family, 3-phenylpropionic acid transporter n=1 Tax=Methylorubrum salsuginis TaxID=414703 RepID=A0A1I4FFZ6_9HYPH|nr:MFS transporter [Methylorubrum salsuginis]SFL16389.1 MFS transporter, PPP family, 3-phenylpropionic acid transporter [Methylorubrum salsuginis]